LPKQKRREEVDEIQKVENKVNSILHLSGMNTIG